MGYLSRTQAFPILFEDDCSGALQWAAAGYGNGTVSYDTTVSHESVGKSIKIATVDSTGAFGFVLIPYLSSSFLFSMYVYFPDSHVSNWYFEITQENGTTYQDFRFHYEPLYSGIPGYWTINYGPEVEILRNFPLAVGAWHYVEIAGNYNTGKWNYMRIDDAKQGLSTYSDTPGPSGTLPRSHIMTWISDDGTRSKMNISDITVTSLSA